MEGLYQWFVLLNVVAAFTFALVHGVTAGVPLKLRGEREIPRVQALLDVSRFAVNTMYVSVLVLLVAGVAAGFIAGLWSKGWIWAAIVLLVLMFRGDVRTCLDLGRGGAVRRGLGVGKGQQPAEQPDAAMLATLTASSRPMEIAAIGYGGLVKPF